MLQQGYGVFLPNSEDKICAGQRSIESMISTPKAGSSSEEAGSVFAQEKDLGNSKKLAENGNTTMVRTKLNGEGGGFRG